MARIPPAEDDGGVPNYVPLVGFDENDEPFIVRTQVIRPSPLPHWLAAVIIVAIIGSVAQLVYFSFKRSADLNCQVKKDKSIVLALQRRSELADRERSALKNLVSGVAKAKTQAQVSDAFQSFFALEDTITKSLANERQIINTLLEDRCG